MSRIHVLGYLGDAAPLSESARARVAAADVVVGGRRHLDALAVPHERRVVLGRVDPALEVLAALGPEQVGVVLASGDPGFFGIVRRLEQAGLDITVDPAPSSCALAFGRVGLAWEDAQVVSAHGRELRPAVNVVRAHHSVAVLTTVGAGIREIAAALTSWPRSLVLLERLGEPDERVRRFTPAQALALDPADIREPNVVLALAEESAWRSRGMPWRLGERGRHRQENAVRGDVLSAIVVGALGPRPGDLVGLFGGLSVVAAAVEERGAALRHLPDEEPRAALTAGLPTLDDPDLLCLAADATDLAEVFPAVADLLEGVRAVAVMTDTDGLEVAARALAGFSARHIVVPESTTYPGGHHDPATVTHLLIATRPGANE